MKSRSLTKLESLELKLKQREEELSFVESMYRHASNEQDKARIRVENFLRFQVCQLRQAVEEKHKLFYDEKIDAINRIAQSEEDAGVYDKVLLPEEGKETK
jgi:hypothetical protein